MKNVGFPLFLCTLCIAAVKSEPAAVGDESDRINAAVGAPIVLQAGVPADSRSGTWRFSCRDIAMWIGNATDINNDYSGRAELLSNGSLRLMSLTVNDSGEYVVTSNPPFSNFSITSRIEMNVLVPVSKPIIAANLSQVLEGNETVTLNCELSGDSPSIRWIKDGKWLQYHDRMNVSSDNQTLTITAVNRTDSGSYQCEGYNPVSKETSDEFLLTVFYGPEEMELSLKPMDEAITLGTNVTLECSAQSVPPSTLNWFFNAEIMEQKGPTLNIVEVHRNKSGNYTCRAYNNMTDKAVQLTRIIKVIEPVSKPIITTDVLYPVEYNDTMTLTCSVTGDVKRIEWSLPDTVVRNDELIKESLDNMTLTLLSVNRSYSGVYRCQAWGIINNETSDPFPVNVSYGPDALTITTDDESEIYTIESNLTLHCIADSVPPAEFEWILNGKNLDQKSQELVIINMTKHDFGNYTCRAYNNHTKMYAVTTKIIATNDISVPKISSSSREPIESNRTVSLTCDVTGQLLSILWSKDHHALPEGRSTTLSENNKTLTISKVDRTDAGNYTCEAAGPLGRKASKLFQLTVYYGPDEPQISMNPEEPNFPNGSNVTLTCLVSSFPAPEFQWYLNGNALLHNEEQLIIFNLRRNNTGNYTCETFNSKTNLSKQKSIQVVLFESNDLEEYGNKSWIAAAVVGVLVIIAVSACAFFRQRN